MRHPCFAALAPLALVALTACTEDGPPASGQAVAGRGDCSAEQYQGLITQSEVALSTMAFPHEVRVIHPGDPVTRDYRADRMNIRIDGSGRIVAVDCG